MCILPFFFRRNDELNSDTVQGWINEEVDSQYRCIEGVWAAKVTRARCSVVDIVVTVGQSTNGSARGEYRTASDTKRSIGKGPGTN
ncbi:hypothetical protein HG530_006821 [Fusarium avenaceum]|nr:hypothetical protein HG530_006821 [Fusarium avenaceum]